MIYRKLKKLKILILFGFLVSCISLVPKKEEIVKEFNNIDPIFVPYIEDFIYLTRPYYRQKTLLAISVGKKDISTENIVGVCKFFKETNKTEIVIDSYFWNKAGKDQKDALMLHELAHCLCGLGHGHIEGFYNEKDSLKDISNGYLEDACPASIMHPIVVTDECYKKHKDHYRYEVRVRCYANRKNSIKN